MTDPERTQENCPNPWHDGAAKRMRCTHPDCPVQDNPENPDPERTQERVWRWECRDGIGVTANVERGTGPDTEYLIVGISHEGAEKIEAALTELEERAEVAERELEAASNALDIAYEFIQSVTQWTGHEDDLAEALDEVGKASEQIARKPEEKSNLGR